MQGEPEAAGLVAGKAACACTPPTSGEKKTPLAAMVVMPLVLRGEAEQGAAKVGWCTAAVWFVCLWSNGSPPAAT